jgi:hypothetical protein
MSVEANCEAENVQHPTPKAFASRHPTLNEAGIQMRLTKTAVPLADKVWDVLANFTKWRDAFGETSWDYQSFFAGQIGGFAKALYYRHRILGTAAVSPMVFFEAFLPSARRLFHRPT